MALIKCRECGESVSTEAIACPRCGAPQQSPMPPPLPVQLPPLQPKEETIFSDKVVAVTTTRVIIWGTTYPLRNISSVRMTFTSPQIGWPILLIIFGIFILFMAAHPLNGDKAPIGVFIIAYGMIAGAILWMALARTHFHVDLTSTSGEIHVLTSKDKAYIQRVVESINEAIVKCR